MIEVLLTTVYEEVIGMIFGIFSTRKRALLDPLQSKAVFPREKEKTRRVNILYSACSYNTISSMHAAR